MPHTPGPWSVSGRTGLPGADIVVKDANGELVGQAYTIHKGAINAEENARLIAAAPDLLAALRNLREGYQRLFDVMPVAWQTWDEIARAAIAKATKKEES